MAELARAEAEFPRRCERRPVRGAVAFRRSGQHRVMVNLLDISVEGFRIETFGGVTDGAVVWVTLPGLAPIEARVVWCRRDEAGCRFVNPLHASVLERLLPSRRT